MRPKLKVFTLCADAAEGGFDSGPVEAFLADKALVEVRDHFERTSAGPRWHLLVLYLELEEPSVQRSSGGVAPRRGPEVPEADRPLYEAIRSWRNDKARAQGISPFTLFTNAEIAAIARLRPRSLERLLQVRGVGQRKAAEHGAEVLALVDAVGGASAAQASEAPEERQGEGDGANEDTD